MSSKTLFRKHLEELLSHAESQVSVFKKMIANYDDMWNRDAISKAVIKMSFHEATLTEGEEKVLRHIRKGVAVSKSDLTTRFARTYDSQKLYGHEGIIRNLILKGMIQRLEDTTLNRVKTFYKAVRAPGEELPEGSGIEPSDSFDVYETILEARLKEQKNNIEPDHDLDAPNIIPMEDFEEISKKLKMKHGLIPGNEEES